MHGNVRVASDETVFQLLYEKAFTPDLRKRSVELAIAFGAHAEYLHVETGMKLLQAHLYIPRLPHGERGLARRDNDA
jgi:hypothetical protein